MIAWMIYAVAASLVVALAALCLEHGLRGRRVALRWVWVAGMTASVMFSVAPWLGWSEAPAAVANGASEIEAGATGLSAAQLVEVDTPVAQSRAFDRLSIPTSPELDRLFLGVVAMLAATGIAVLIFSYRRLSRRRRGWHATTIEGVPTLISRSVGPAVVGYLNPAIVLPAWVAGMDDRGRRLVVMHEKEHLNARDNQLLGLATLVVALMPWNAALWWQLRRLRQGVELDCDRRVLARAPDAERYGELLIEMGQRASRGEFALAAFAESSSFLERRIRNIVLPRPGRARLVLGSIGALGLASSLLAWTPPGPPSREALVPSAESSPVSAPASTRPADVAFSDAPIARRPRVEELVQRDYPEIFANGLDINRAIWFAIDRNGDLRRSWIGPNLYINLGAAGGALRELELPVGSIERAIAEAEHQRREQEVLQANVPDLEIRSMYAGYFSGGGGSAVVHFVTEDRGAGNWGRFRVASAFVADAIDAELGP